jgi:hypothetical protein
MGCWKETLTDADNFAISFPEEMELPNKERHQLYRNYSLKPTGFLVCVSSEACFVQYLLFSVADPDLGSGVFFTPGSGIFIRDSGWKKNPDPG